MAEVKVAKTGRSALMLVLIIAVIIAAAAAIVLIPGVLENLAWVALIVMVAIAVIAAVIWLCMIVLAIPMYAMKGEQYQTGISYDLDDVKPVKETSSEEKKVE